MSSPSDPRPKTLKSGRYELLRTLGLGSQAETYEARDHGVVNARPAPGQLVDDWNRYVSRARRGDTPNAHGLVAVKSFHVGRAKAWKDVELAEREARTLSSLTHPNLPRYIEHFEEEGALYLVMEMVEGESLASLRARGRISSVAEVTRMLHDIGDALRYLHGRAPAVVHRDIKPGNVIRRHDGSYALVDFGAVRDRLKPEGGSTVVGTFGYMAPEQFQGRASGKSDLYGLAATALVMLTGTEPEALPHVGLGIDVDRALPGGTPRPLVRALAAMLAPDPDRRVGSIDEALALLAPDTQAAAHGRVRAPGPREPAPARGRSRREDREARTESRAAEKRARRDAKRRRRAAARGRRAPFVPRVVGKLALSVALVVVWLTVGVVVPLVLVLLSPVFGGALRRAAKACRRAAMRAGAALQRGSAWLSGEPAAGDAVEAAAVAGPGASTSSRVRVGAVADAAGEGHEAGRLRIDDDDAARNDHDDEHEHEHEHEPDDARGRKPRRASRRG